MKRGQVWVETVIYTLIAFVMIGAVLAFIKPKIEEIRDKALIEQTIEVIESINFGIIELGGEGNKRIIELGIKKGILKIDGENNLIIFEIESRHVYSQPGEDIYIGNIIAMPMIGYPTGRSIKQSTLLSICMIFSTLRTLRFSLRSLR